MRIMDRGEHEARAFLSRLRPRVSLASGSIFVLLTLFLPIGYEACGPKRAGYELLQGKGEWPTFLGILVSKTAGRDFYILVLSLAAFTAILVLLSFLAPGLCPRPALTHPAFALTGTVSLFLLSDVLLILAFAEQDYGWAALVLVLASCLAPGLFWPKRMFWGWVSVLAILISVFLIADSMQWGSSAVKTALTISFVAIYVLVPLALWWRYRILSRRFDPARWIAIRRGLVAFYLPAVVGNLWFFVVAWNEGVWGFVPCYVGIHLITLGYMRLFTEAQLAATQVSAGGP
jgi:hypothetical protein